MLNILRKIINKVNSEGYQCTLVIGNKEIISIYQADVPMFYFDMPEYSYNYEKQEKTIKLKYAVGINSEQNSNDIDLLFSTISEVEVLNDLFLKKLFSYENGSGQQIFENTNNIKVVSFLDLKMMSHTLTGLYVEVEFKNLLTNACKWEV